MTCDSEFDFTLVLSGVDDLTEAVEDALFEAGCDDATLAVRHGRIYMTFSRLAPSLDEAILSAICDVRRAKGIKADVLRVDDCSLVTQSEIARRSNRSRQLIQMYITGERGPGDFPGPACNIVDKQPFWHWCEVSYWMYVNNIVREDVFKQAEVLDTVNQVLDWQRLERRHPDRLKKFRRRIEEECDRQQALDASAT